jgi:F-type H+-transporting ATPase subunit a
VIAHPPSIFEVLSGAIPAAFQTLAAAVAAVLLIAWWVRRDIERSPDHGLIPAPRFTLRGFVEVLLEALVSLMKSTIGPKWPSYLPLVGTLALFILVANLMGLVPGLGGATSYVETNASWALMAFGVSEYVAIREQGVWSYFSHLIGPVWWLAPLMLVVEVISHFARLVSLTLRLTGNMFADHTLVAVFLAFPVINLFVPWLFMGLGLFVAFVQAFIFAFLTIIYIGQAVAEPHGHAEAHDH